MSFQFKQAYPIGIEREMRNYFNSLSEKDSRRYAAIEARKLNHGGIAYLCRVLECVGLSRDTSEFASDSFNLFWQEDGKRLYPSATEILMICDGGGSNGCRTHIFKQDMQSVVNEIGVPIRIAHYPPYCSKYNPIERRLFCHVTRACQGVLFDTLQTVVELMNKTTTSTGLSVTVRVLSKIYEVGRKATKEFRKMTPILFDTDRPLWNYRIEPQIF